MSERLCGKKNGRAIGVIARPIEFTLHHLLPPEAPPAPQHGPSGQHDPVGQQDDPSQHGDPG
jgi:hypothetical protein